MTLRPLLVVAFLALAAPAAAAETWRWVDENGRTHFGDVVPERYRSKAVRLGPLDAGPTDAQRRDAEARLARERAAADKFKRSAPPARGVDSPPAARTGNLTPCEAAKRKYEVSAECYGRYRIVSGIKPEAFENCGPAVLPPDC